MKLTPLLLPLGLCAVLLSTSCGGGGGSSAGPATGQFLVGDSPVDDLLAFSGVIGSVRLERADGSLGPELLAVDREVEFLGLQETSFWLANAPVPAGTYAGVRVEFLPFSYSSRTRLGNDVNVHATNHVLDASLPAPLTVSGSGTYRFDIDLDLFDSLSGDVTAGSIDFDPRGSTVVDSGASEAPIDEIRGAIVSVDRPASRFVVDAFADGDLTVPLGEVTVQVEPSTVLFDDDDAPLSLAAFFAALVPGSSFVEVHGALTAAGLVRAQRIELEDDGIQGGGDLVRIEGLLGAFTAEGFELMIREIEKGASIAVPVLSGLGNPSTIRVSTSPSTRYLLDDDQPASAQDLAVGQIVKVRFAAFSSEPFPAHEVEIEEGGAGGAAEFDAFIHDLSGLPGSMIVRLRHDGPAVLSGMVASPSTNVVVDLTGSTLFLDTENRPALTTNQLLTGLKVEVEGTLSGPPSAPTIAANRTKVRAGRLDDAFVLTTDAAGGRFSTTGGELEDPFGDGVTAGPLHVRLVPATVFDDDASSSASFFQLFADLSASEVLEVEVFGIGSGTPNEVLGYEIRARVED